MSDTSVILAGILIVVLALCAAVLILAWNVRESSLRTQDFARRALDHALAINVDEREYIRVRLAAERDDVVLGRSERAKMNGTPSIVLGQPETSGPHANDDMTIDMTPQTFAG